MSVTRTALRALGTVGVAGLVSLAGTGTAHAVPLERLPGFAGETGASFGTIVSQRAGTCTVTAAFPIAKTLPTKTRPGSGLAQAHIKCVGGTSTPASLVLGVRNDGLANVESVTFTAAEIKKAGGLVSFTFADRRGTQNWRVHAAATCSRCNSAFKSGEDESGRMRF